MYFPLYTEAEWDMVRRNHEAAAAEQAAVDRRTIDLVQPGEFDQEAAHSMATTRSEYWQLGGRGMRDGGWGPGNFTEFTMAVRPGPTAVRALYWGEDVDKDFFITVDGKPLVHVQRKGPPVKQFVAAEYPLPPAIVPGKNKVRVRFEAGTTKHPCSSYERWNRPQPEPIGPFFRRNRRPRRGRSGSSPLTASPASRAGAA